MEKLPYQLSDDYVVQRAFELTKREDWDNIDYPRGCR